MAGERAGDRAVVDRDARPRATISRRFMLFLIAQLPPGRTCFTRPPSRYVVGPRDASPMEACKRRARSDVQGLRLSTAWERIADGALRESRRRSSTAARRGDFPRSCRAL